MLLNYPRDIGALSRLEGDDAAVELTPIDPEDMVRAVAPFPPRRLSRGASADAPLQWHAYNLIQVGDVVKADAVRNKTIDTATGSSTASRVRTRLTVKILLVFFDPLVSQLKLDGVVLAEDPPVDAMGRRHTLDLELNRTFRLWKKQGWDAVAIRQLRDALEDGAEDAVAAVVMQEGLASVCLITNHRTVLKQRVDAAVPKKRSAAADQDAGMRKFYAKVQAAVVAAFDPRRPRMLLLASPGFVAQGFRTYLAGEAARAGDKDLARMAADAVVVHVSTGHLHSLNEVMQTREVQALAKNRKFRRESSDVDAFFVRLRKDDGRAWYGVGPVKKAVEEGAVGKGGGVLLLSNALFRSMDIATRRFYVALHDKATADGGEVHILSSDHESGQRLDGLGGIAAMLTYPMFDLDEDEEEEVGGEEGGHEGEESIV